MPKELQILKAQVELLREAHIIANEALRSAWAVAKREGKNTNWNSYKEKLRYFLEISHAAIASLSNTPDQMENNDK